jgi:hypothetical protein
MRRLLATATAALLALGVGSVAGSAATPTRADTNSSYNGLALTPPMGFNDWNAFGCNITADLIKQTALAMHNNGMQAAGYEYVNTRPARTYLARDLWAHTGGIVTRAIDVGTIPAHGSVLLKVSSVPGRAQ